MPSNWWYNNRPMSWLKFWTTDCFNASYFNKLSSQECGVFIKYLVLAAISPKKGTVCLDGGEKDVPYSPEQRSALIKEPTESLLSIEAKLVGERMITIKDGGVIVIENWNKYQDDFQKNKKWTKQRDFEAEEDPCTLEQLNKVFYFFLQVKGMSKVGIPGSFRARNYACIKRMLKNYSPDNINTALEWIMKEKFEWTLETLEKRMPYWAASVQKTDNSMTASEAMVKEVMGK